ncbi:hypothetical protein BGY98DRAFT_295216 [Russula aff. rugulosa BPL654]|nr:hypothetical protein BGY98DRAFT_295216 [Russula aff. rugulosa BPL654]
MFPAKTPPLVFLSSGEHGAVYLHPISNAAAAARMNSKPQLCICHSRHDQVDSAHLPTADVRFFCFSHRMIAIFAIFWLGLLPIVRCAPFFPLARRDMKLFPPFHMLTADGQYSQGGMVIVLTLPLIIFN